MTWVDPTDITAEQDASSTQFNEEVLGNLRYLKGRLDDWQTAITFTPQLYQNGNRTSSIAVGRALVDPDGKLCFLHILMNCSAAGSAGNSIEVRSIPAAIAPRKAGAPNGGADPGEIGSGYILDAGTAYYSADSFFLTTSSIAFYWRGATTGTLIGANPNFALANNDRIGADIIYELA